MFPIIEKLGGEVAVLPHLQVKPQSWRHLRLKPTLSGRMMRTLMQMADKQGISYRADDFVNPPGEDTGSERSSEEG